MFVGALPMECIAAGFDVGNLNSHIAIIYRDGRVEIVSNEYGDRKTPTYVTFAGKLRLVGTAAVLQDTITAKSFGNFLPLLGKRVGDVPEDQWKHFNGKITTLNEDERMKIKMEFNNMEWEITPEQLLAMQLIKLKQNSRMHSDNSDIPVGISVPCYLTDPERRAMLDAAKVADLRNVTLVNHVDARTEVAICGFQKGAVEIQSVEYDANLGGRDFDQAIFEQLTGEFEKANGVKIDRHSKRAERIRRECANLKVKLSANKVSLPIRVDGLGSGKVLQAQMSREELERLCEKLVLRFRGVLESCLCSSKLKTVDVIELVGGSSRIPILKEMIYKVFNKRPQSTLNAEEVIARGCAIQSAATLKHFKVENIKPVCFNLYSISLCWTSSTGEKTIELFPKTYKTPPVRTVRVTFSAGFVLNLRYSQSKLHIGTLKFSTKSKVYQTFRIKLKIDNNGLVVVDCVEKIEDTFQTNSNKNETGYVMIGTSNCNATTEDSNYMIKSVIVSDEIDDTAGENVNISVEFTGYREERLREFITTEAEILKIDTIERERLKAKNDLEAYIFVLRNRLREFEDSVEKKELHDLVEQISNWVKESDENTGREAFEQQQTKLEKKSDLLNKMKQTSQVKMKELKQTIDQYRATLNEIGETKLNPDSLKVLEQLLADADNWTENRSSTSPTEICEKHETLVRECEKILDSIAQEGNKTKGSLTVALPEPANQGLQENQGTGQEKANRTVEIGQICDQIGELIGELQSQLYGCEDYPATARIRELIESVKLWIEKQSDKATNEDWQQRKNMLHKEMDQLIAWKSTVNENSPGSITDVQDRIMDYRFVASEHTINFQDALMQFKKTFGLGVRGTQNTFVWTLEAAEHQQSLISDMKQKLRTFQQRSSQMFQDLLKALEQLRNNCKTSMQTQKEIESVMKNSKTHVNFLNKDYRHTIVLLQEYEGWLKQQLTKLTHTSGQVEFDNKGQETNRLQVEKYISGIVRDCEKAQKAYPNDSKRRIKHNCVEFFVSSEQ
ncbi:hypothetical protein PHET_05797 [Paragonimus heterotremus]|uniref:Uncharacterized protein n=1 Tax=Paragonimus heterotremus TaxID=100268 RepID=A0A8J4SKX2_9TREM|nr:hypothetical protein PHET_05797 [Paragonimus heterotremus]